MYRLPDGRVDQMWFADGASMRSAGLLSGEGVERVVLLLDGRIGGATAVGITVEPAGGSTRPTTEPPGLMDLPA
ncbi:anti-sigma factor [Streptomyces sp. NPDC050418]|uniref:anti-sigma factor n=1 Tax=Streptomyces sp. NPDC050418 TaxID=3365612 RepID=UPI0037908E7E